MDAQAGNPQAAPSGGEGGPAAPAGPTTAAGQPALLPGRLFSAQGGLPVSSGAALLGNLSAGASQLQAALAPVAARVARARLSQANAEAAAPGVTPREAAKLQLTRLVSRFDGVLASHAHASADVKAAVREAKEALERELAALQDERSNCVALTARRNAAQLRDALAAGGRPPLSLAAGAADLRTKLQDAGARLRAANDAASAAALAALSSAVEAVSLLDQVASPLGAAAGRTLAPYDDKDDAAGYNDAPEDNYHGDAARDREAAAAAAAAAQQRKQPAEYDMADLLGPEAAAAAARAEQVIAFGTGTKLSDEPQKS